LFLAPPEEGLQREKNLYAESYSKGETHTCQQDNSGGGPLEIEAERAGQPKNHSDPRDKRESSGPSGWGENIVLAESTLRRKTAIEIGDEGANERTEIGLYRGEERKNLYLG